MYELVMMICYGFVFAFGASIGSFLNVVIYRIPNNLSVAQGRSFCPICKSDLRGYELIPIIGYLFLKGRCKHCISPISKRYPLVEFLGGVVACLCFYELGYTFDALLTFCFCAIIFSIAFIDWDTQIIPNGLVFVLAVVTVLMPFFASYIGLTERLIGMVAISIPMLVTTILIADAFGGGDIKLMAVCGFALGWKGVLLAFFLSLMFASIYLIFLLSQKKYSKNAHIPFGPFLAGGVVLSLFYEAPLIHWYLGFFGLL